MEVVKSANVRRLRSEHDAINRHGLYPRPHLKPGQEAVQVLCLRVGDRVDLGSCVVPVEHISRRGHPVLANGITLCPRTMLVAREIRHTTPTKPVP